MSILRYWIFALGIGDLVSFPERIGLNRIFINFFLENPAKLLPRESSKKICIF